MGVITDNTTIVTWKDVPVGAASFKFIVYGSAMPPGLGVSVGMAEADELTLSFGGWSGDMTAMFFTGEYYEVTAGQYLAIVEAYVDPPLSVAMPGGSTVTVS